MWYYLGKPPRALALLWGLGCAGDQFEIELVGPRRVRDQQVQTRTNSTLYTPPPSVTIVNSSTLGPKSGGLRDIHAAPTSKVEKVSAVASHPRSLSSRCLLKIVIRCNSTVYTAPPSSTTLGPKSGGERPGLNHN